MSYAVGTITPANGVGSEAFTGVGFQPKLVCFRTVSNDVGSSLHASYAHGCATSSTSRFSVWAGSKQIDPSQASTRTSAAHVLEIFDGSTTTATEYQMDLVSLDADGFTIDRETDNMTTQPVIHYQAWGDLTNVAIARFTIPAGTGVFTVCDASCSQTQTIGFQGDFMMLVAGNTTADDTDTAHAALNLGWAISTTKAGLVSALTEDAAATTDSRKYMRVSGTAEAWARLNEASDAVIQRMSFSQWLSTGFEMNMVETTASATIVYAVVMKGGTYDIGNFLSQTGTGNFNITTSGVGTPIGAIIFMDAQAGDATLDTAQGGFNFMLGATDSLSNEGATQVNVPDSTALNDALCSASDITHAYIRYPVTAAVGCGTVDGTAMFSSFSANTITLNQDDADSSQRFVGYVAFGSNAAASLRPRKRVIRWY